MQESCHFSSLFSRNVRIFFCSLRYIKELSKLFTKTCKVRFWLIRFGYKMFLFRFFTYIFCSIKRFLKTKGTNYWMNCISELSAVVYIWLNLHVYSLWIVLLNKQVPPHKTLGNTWYKIYSRLSLLPYLFYARASPVHHFLFQVK